MHAIPMPRTTKWSIAAPIVLIVTVALTIVLLLAAMTHEPSVVTRIPASPITTICQVAGYAVPCS